MLDEQAGGWQERRRQALGANVIQALPNQPNGILDRGTIGLATLGGTRVARQARGMHETQQAFPMHAGHGLHFVQQPTLLGTISAQVARAHPSEVFPTFRKCHLCVVLHGAPSNIFT